MGINNLYVTYDDDGQPHFHVNDEEVTEQEWMLRHPNMKEGNANGGNSIGGLGQRGRGSVTTDGSDAKERQRQGLREHRARVKAEAQDLVGNDESAEGRGRSAGKGEDAVG